MAGLLHLGWHRPRRSTRPVSLLLDEPAPPPGCPYSPQPAAGTEWAWGAPQPFPGPATAPQPVPVPAATAPQPVPAALVAAPPPPPEPLDITACRRSIASLTVSPAKCAGSFYACLFRDHPDWRFGMFPPQMDTQNERLFGALVRIVGLLDNPAVLGQYLAQLGADHRKYGVRAEHYPAVGAALLKALREHCAAWDDRAEAAWLAAYTFAADAMIAGAEACTGPASWHGQVIRHQMLTGDLVVLEIQTGEPLPYEPGQFVTIQHPKWKNVWRQFSVASAPVAGADRFELIVRQVPGGWVSTALTRDTGVPSELTIGPPVGGMTADSAGGHDLLLVGGGVGIAPVKALAADVLRRDESALAGGWGRRRNITLFHGARNPLELVAAPELRELERTYPWFSWVPVVSDDKGFRGQQGNVAAAVLETEWPGRHAFLAGPAAMIEETACGLSRAGLDEDEVHFDHPGDR